LSDRWGRRLPLLLGGLLYALAAIGCALTHSIGWLLAGRLTMALGGAAGSVITRAMVRDWFEPKEAAHVYSTLMLVMGAAPILAPLLGGQLLLFTGWRGLFVAFAAFGTACTVAVAMWLPESLPAERRARGGLGDVFRAYGRLLLDRRFTAFALAGGFASGLLFTYITGAAAVLMDLYAVPAQRFGFFFGANACGLIAGSQVNRRLLKKYHSEQILRSVYHVTVGASLLLLLHGLTGWGGLPVLSVLLFVLLTTMGFIYPNLSALTMAPYGKEAGSASALFGTAQYLIGCVAGGMVSLFHDGSERPMTLLMAANGVIGWLLVRRALKRA
jgi:DHA1 family bicyclomycin/chloramphenicol resistance-like MFS transporter